MIKTKLQIWVIEKLGGIPLSHKRVREWKHGAYLKSLTEIRATIEKSDKVYLEPVTLFGEFLTVTNCVFLGDPKSN